MLTFLREKERIFDIPGGGRTHNLQLRRLTRYPLRYRDNYAQMSFQLNYSLNTKKTLNDTETVYIFKKYKKDFIDYSNNKVLKVCIYLPKLLLGHQAKQM